MPNAVEHSIEDDERWMARAVELAGNCPPSATAFSVGAVIVADGRVLGEGWSRAEDPRDHAETVAARRAAGPIAGATVYSSMEPCGRRSADKAPCAVALAAAGVARVVYALPEPTTFVEHPNGADYLREHGVAVDVMPAYAAAAERPNAHLL